VERQALYACWGWGVGKKKHTVWLPRGCLTGTFYIVVYVCVLCGCFFLGRWKQFYFLFAESFHRVNQSRNLHSKVHSTVIQLSFNCCVEDTNIIRRTLYSKRKKRDLTSLINKDVRSPRRWLLLVNVVVLLQPFFIAHRLLNISLSVLFIISFFQVVCLLKPILFVLCLAFLHKPVSISIPC